MATDVTTTVEVLEACFAPSDFQVSAPDITPNSKSNGAVDFSLAAAQWTTTNSPPSSVAEGVGFDIASRDATNELCFISHAFNAPNRMQCNTLANNGVIFTLYTGAIGGSADFRTYRVGGSDTSRLIPGHLPYIINPNMAGEVEGGTWDITDLQSFLVAAAEVALFGTSNSFNYISQFGVITKGRGNLPALTGTTVTLREFYEDLWDALNDFADRHQLMVRKLGDTFEMGMPFQIGDGGTTTTTASDEGKTYISPGNNDPADPRWRIQGDDMSMVLETGSSDVITLTGTYIWSLDSTFFFDQTAGTVTFDAATFKGMGPILLGTAVSGKATFDGAGSLVMTGVIDIDGSTIANSNAEVLAAGISEDGGVFTDQTADCRDVAGTDDVDLIPGGGAADDRFYIGKSRIFDEAQIDISTPGAGTYTIVWEYFDHEGSWVALSPTDNTNSFKNADLRTVTFTPPQDWAPTTINSQGPFFYIRAEVQSGTITTVPKGENIQAGPAAAVVLDTIGTYTDLIITNADRAIEIKATGTYTFSGHTYSGNTIDVRNTSGGAVTINVTNGGSVPSVEDVEDSVTTVNNAVTIRVTVTDTGGTPIENARVRLVADETVGTITTGDVILTGLSNASGIIEDTAFNYEGAFDPSGLDCLLTVRQGSVTPFKKPLEDGAATVTTAGFITVVALVGDE